MVNPYRRGLGLGGRGEPMPYTGGGSARPLEPYRGGGRAVQLEDDPYADPSRTGPTYGDDGAGESTYGYEQQPGGSRGRRPPSARDDQYAPPDDRSTDYGNSAAGEAQSLADRAMNGEDMPEDHPAWAAWRRKWKKVYMDGGMTSEEADAELDRLLDEID